MWQKEGNGQIWEGVSSHNERAFTEEDITLHHRTLRSFFGLDSSG